MKYVLVGRPPCHTAVFKEENAPFGCEALKQHRAINTISVGSVYNHFGHIAVDTNGIELEEARWHQR
jgi:hypothetical protein